MLNRQYLSNGGIAQLVQPGDTQVTGEVFPSPLTATAQAINGSMLQSGWVNRNPAAAGTDTIDPASSLIATMSQGLGTVGVQPGTTFRVNWFNDSANAITVTAAANSGVTVNKPTVNAGSVKEFLVTVVNGTPGTALAGTTTNGSAVLTGLTDAQLALVTPGMVVTNAIAGLQGATVLGVNRTNNTVTMSANATATTAVSLNLSPVVVVQGIGQKVT